ncbi:Dps family protein [Mesomycoplasma bovoculi]|uniref:DNA-binding ferritin-like protein n=1 Tax=Mesomycoplasma bovoculi M165/69 TaxID=743966 RepID=W5UTI8_9BACT|nr:DNA starvation/stationary phase protection protein [Mesomycoplasma bovoculi]AHH45406.1 DNA-binding ferritin-like protein [Mesomycoplasma bovoculi M165/69]
MQTLTNKIEKLQASLFVLYNNIKNFHWNVQGSNFLVVHKYTDKLASQTIDFVDEVAEKNLMFGKFANTDFDEIRKNSLITLETSKFYSEKEVWSSLSEQISKILDFIKSLYEVQNPQLVLLTPLLDELVLYYHKQLWQINASKQ